jgi:hypothetical protein
MPYIDRTPKIDTKIYLGMFACFKDRSTGEYTRSEIVSVTPATLTLKDGQKVVYSRGQWFISIYQIWVEIHTDEGADIYIRNQNNKIRLNDMLEDFEYKVIRSGRYDETSLDEIEKHLEKFFERK